jgi:hypothetical protein
MNVNLETKLTADSDAVVLLAYDSEAPMGSAFEINAQVTAYLSDLKSRGELSCKTGKSIAGRGERTGVIQHRQL